jgi:hypothetical protein
MKIDWKDPKNLWKYQCKVYAAQSGYELQPNNSIYLENTTKTFFEIFDFSTSDGDIFIKCYNVLKIEKDIVYSENNYILIETFEEFKKVFDELVERYKTLKIKVKLDKIETDFD